MNTAEIAEMAKKHLMNNYGERNLALVKGSGAKVWDADGREYLDFMSGLAVNILGHCHPEVVAAIKRQADTLIHVSNLYLIEPQVQLAALLTSACFAEKCFFCNSGTEANEAAFKLVRKYWSLHGKPEAEIIAMRMSFHGRTIGSLAATGQEKYQKGFEPFPTSIRFADFGDVGSLKASITPKTGAVILEPIQAEGGVNVPRAGYFREVRSLCDEAGIFLILDEVQTGMGRTGKLFAHEHDGIEPDIMTLAKGLAGGVPIGAMVAKAHIAEAFGPGSHAATFGGNPLACAAAIATCNVLLRPGFMEEVLNKSEFLFDSIRKTVSRYSSVKEVRGKGFLVGIELDRPVADMIAAFRKRGIIVGSAGERVLRLLPPLIVAREEISRVATTLGELLAECSKI